MIQLKLHGGKNENIIRKENKVFGNVLERFLVEYQFFIENIIKKIRCYSHETCNMYA